MCLVVPVPTSFSSFVLNVLLRQTVNASHPCYPLQFIGNAESRPDLTKRKVAPLCIPVSHKNQWFPYSTHSVFNKVYKRWIRYRYQPTCTSLTKMPRPQAEHQPFMITESCFRSLYTSFTVLSTHIAVTCLTVQGSCSHGSFMCSR
jgi:hypothetical protein